uniref:RecB family exonuclease n=1 Tax=Candidatus Limnocylindrus sp. TaxID=2802978 RepID=UPI00404B234A
RSSSGVRPRKVSRFVAEALDLSREQLEDFPLTGEPASKIDGLAIVAPPLPVLPVREPRAGESAPLTLSFTAIEAFIACPLRYHYQQRLRIPLPPHHSATYGAAMHAAVAEFHRGQMAGTPPQLGEIYAALERSWQSAGFLSRSHEEARHTAAQEAIARFRSEEMATGHAPAYVEKDFSFELGGHKIRGRWDRVDVQALPPEGRSAPIPTIDVPGDVVRPTLPLGDDEWVVVSDYKTGGRDDDDASRKRAKESLQLQLYALAWRAATGRLPDEVSLRFLDTGRVATVPVEPKRIVKARELIVVAAEGILAGVMDPKPELMTCTYCSYRELCPASKAPAGRPA